SAALALLFPSSHSRRTVATRNVGSIKMRVDTVDDDPLSTIESRDPPVEDGAKSLKLPLDQLLLSDPARRGALEEGLFHLKIYRFDA
ncbi:MAG: hypothetical protein AAGN46_17525, partial [Acidobacteriota bacterium]